MHPVIEAFGLSIQSYSLFAAIAALVCAAAAVLLLTVRIGGRLYRRADVIDARSAALSCAD